MRDALEKTQRKIKEALPDIDTIAHGFCTVYGFAWEELSPEAKQAFKRIAKRSRDSVATAILRTGQRTSTVLKVAQNGH